MISQARPAAPPARSTQSECDSEALATWHGVHLALKESLHESSFNEWIHPLICHGFKPVCETPVLLVGGASQLHRLWIEGALGDEWQNAIGATGLPGLRIEFVEIDH